MRNQKYKSVWNLEIIKFLLLKGLYRISEDIQSL